MKNIFINKKFRYYFVATFIIINSLFLVLLFFKKISKNTDSEILYEISINSKPGRALISKKQKNSFDILFISSNNRKYRFKLLQSAFPGSVIEVFYITADGMQSFKRSYNVLYKKDGDIYPVTYYINKKYICGIIDKGVYESEFKRRLLIEFQAQLKEFQDGIVEFLTHFSSYAHTDFNVEKSIYTTMLYELGVKQKKSKAKKYVKTNVLNDFKKIFQDSKIDTNSSIDSIQ